MDEIPKHILEPHESEAVMGRFLQFLLRRNAGYLCVPVYGVVLYKAWPVMDGPWRYGALSVGVLLMLLSVFLFVWGGLWFSKTKKERLRINKEQREQVLGQMGTLENAYIALMSVLRESGAWEKTGGKEPSQSQELLTAMRGMKEVLLKPHNEYPVVGIDAFENEERF